MHLSHVSAWRYETGGGHRTVVLSCYYFRAVSHKAASLSVSALSVFSVMVSKHFVLQGNSLTDPFQSVCISLSVNSCRSLHVLSLGPKQPWMEF